MADDNSGGNVSRSMLVRADFGAGIDQSQDAWRVPPSQLSQLVNARLERIGSIRKRFGYVSTTVPSSGTPSTGAPIAAVSSGPEVSVIDRSRDESMDCSPVGSVQFPIANECAYVARDYAPMSANKWTTHGAASDVIGDVVTWDGSAGDFDDAFDIGCDDSLYVFLVKITRAKKTFSTAALGGTQVTMTVSQFDAQTGALISSQSQTLSGYVYPKLLVYSQFQTLVVSAAKPNSRAAINTTTTAATVDLWTLTYTSAGLSGFVYSPPTTRQQDCDWSDLSAFLHTSAERYRPIVPYDISAASDALVFACYSSRTNTVRLNNFTVTAGTLTVGGATDIAKPGALPIVAMTIQCDAVAGTFGLGATLMSLNMALATPWQAADGVLFMAECDTKLLTVIVSANDTIPRIVGVAHLCPGGITIAKTTNGSGAYPRQWTCFAEVQQFDDVSPYNVYGHYVRRGQFTISGSPPVGLISSDDLSVATPAARALTLPSAYASTVTSTGRLQVRVPLVLASSQQNWLGEGAANENTTTFGSNYTSAIGTAILTGPIQRITTCVNSPAQTVAPRLLPTAGPRAFAIGNVVHVPHRVAVDGTGAFSFATIKLTRRAPGDVFAESFGNVPHFTGGVVQTLDGVATAETTVVDRPYIMGIVPSNAGVAIDFQPGDYLVQACFAYRDASGAMHRSTPSDPFRLTIAGANDTWTIYYSRASYLNRTDAVVEFYITSKGGTNLRYWFTTSASTTNPSDLAFGTTSTTVRDRGALGPNAIGLPANDAPLLYTSTGALPYVPVPSARFAFLFRNRLVVGGADDSKTIYYSNAAQAYQGASFAAGNTLRINHESGCTAGGALNDKLVFWTPQGMYATFGQFRDEDGNGNALSEMESLHNAIGCTQPQSVISVQSKIIFMGVDNRFYLVDERLALVPIGLRVQETTIDRGYNKVTAAVHLSEEREVRFYMQSATNTRGIALIYNYQLDQWSEDQIVPYYAINSTWGGGTYCDAFGCFVVGAKGWLSDKRTQYLDDSTYYSMTVRTAWIQPSDSQGYQRMRYAYVLGRYVGAHDLQVRAFADFDGSTPKGTAYFTDAQLQPTNGSYPEQIRMQVATQKTQAVQVEISDQAPLGTATNGQGPQLVGLALDVTPLGGSKRIPATRKA